MTFGFRQHRRAEPTDERMPSQEPRDVVEELFRRVVARDFAAIDEHMAEDLVNHAAGG